MDLVERGSPEEETDAEEFAEIVPRALVQRGSEEHIQADPSRDTLTPRGSTLKKPRPFAVATSQDAGLANIHSSQFSTTRKSSR
jgi:hypothetical protein